MMVTIELKIDKKLLNDIVKEKKMLSCLKDKWGSIPLEFRDTISDELPPKMKINTKMRIRKNTEYQIITKSKHFLKKYGTESPTIIIEDSDKEVFGYKWHQIMNNPAVVSFMIRITNDGLERKMAQERAFYGKVYVNGSFGLGELVFESELEKYKIKNNK